MYIFRRFLGTKERISTEKSSKNIQKEENKISVWESFKLLLKNKYFLLLTVVFVINYTILGVNNGLRIYYARDVLGNVGLMGTLTLCFILPKSVSYTHLDVYKRQALHYRLRNR